MTSGNAHEIHALSGAYAVDALDPAERAEFEAHLAACTACQAEVASLRDSAARLGETAAAEPPAALRDRLLAEIRTVRPLPPEAPADEDRGRDTVRALPLRRRLTALVAAASLIGVAGVGAVVWQQQQTSSEQSPADRVLQAADAQRVSVELPGGVSASVVRSVSERKAVLVTRNMPAPPEGKVYELWLQDRAGAMVPAGLMSEPGSRPVVLEGDAAAATGVGITVEPAGGSKSPTSDPIVVFDFEKAT